MQIVGHRGAAGYAPENTLLSFRRAMEIGCRAVEMDVRLSEDGEAVIIHDAKVDRVTDGRGRVSQMTVAELKALHCPLGQRIPTLQEAIDLCRGRAKMFLDIKSSGTPERVVELLKANKIEHEVVILSFSLRLITKVKRLNPRLKVVYLLLRKPLLLWRHVKNLSIDFIGPRRSMTNSRLVKQAHKRNCKVYVYEINDVAGGARMKRLKTDVICTDYPIIFLPRRPQRNR